MLILNYHQSLFLRLQKLELMLKNVCFIEERSPKILTEYRQKLTDKVKELLEQNPIEESRILTEVAIFADKICVDEETVRLRGHVEHMKRDLPMIWLCQNVVLS